MAFLVKSAVKQYIAKKGKRTGADALEALDAEVKELLDKAVRRAAGMGTIKKRHV